MNSCPYHNDSPTACMLPRLAHAVNVLGARHVPPSGSRIKRSLSARSRPVGSTSISNALSATRRLIGSAKTRSAVLRTLAARVARRRPTISASAVSAQTRTCLPLFSLPLNNTVPHFPPFRPYGIVWHFAVLDTAGTAAVAYRLQLKYCLQKMFDARPAPTLAARC